MLHRHMEACKGESSETGGMSWPEFPQAHTSRSSLVSTDSWYGQEQCKGAAHRLPVRRALRQCSEDQWQLRSASTPPDRCEWSPGSFCSQTCRKQVQSCVLEPSTGTSCCCRLLKSCCQRTVAPNVKIFQPAKVLTALAWQLGFDPRNPHGGRKEPALTRCPQTHTWGRGTCAHTHKCKKLMYFVFLTF